MQKNQPMPALKAGNTEKKRGDLPMGQEYLPGDTPQQRLQDLMKEYILLLMNLFQLVTLYLQVENYQQ